MASNGVTDFLAAAGMDGDAGTTLVSDRELESVLTAAIRLYAARSERSGTFPPPISSDATATEVVTVVSEMLRAVDINMFDLSMWFGRRRG